MASEETVYCLCRQPYDETRFMIECNVCKDWFHGTCVDIQEYQAADIEIYHCPNCQLIQGPLVLKKRRNWHRHDYSEADDNINKAVQTGTVMFVKELKCRTFPSAEQMPLLRLHGSELTVDYLEKNGFDVPILVEKVDGLNVKLPPSNFSIQDVENHVGSMREIDVIDVARQEDYKMLMREWTEYYASPNRHKILNVISLEFTNTKLSELVDPPQIVHDLSWVSSFWPHDQPPEDVMFHRPEVQRYCLMGVKDSFTDFHIDFGGTSVWYHVLRGEKIFYMIKPTPSNLALYENWVSSCRQSEMFFGDQVDVCYRCVIKQGQTIFIPTGWIHAVLTPIDSLVFGGNFLHSLNIDLQIRIYEIEKAVDTPEKYLFPNFETVHWYAAKNIFDTIQESREMGKMPPAYLVSGLKALVGALKSWTNRKEYIKRDAIPETIQYGRLLKELQKEVKHLTQSTSSSIEHKSRQKSSGGQTMVKDENSQHTHKTKKKKKVKLKADGSKTKAKSAGGMDKTKTKGKADRVKHDADVENKHVGDISGSSMIPKIKVRLPKADISIYDFDDDDNGGGIMPKVENEVKPSLLELKQPGLKSAKSAAAGLRLKVSGGKIVTGSPGSGTTPSKSSHTGRFQLLGGGTAVKKESPSDFDSDNSDDQLVVDETPRKRKRENKSATAIKPGSLKLKLSVNRTPASNTGVSNYANPLDRFGSFPNSTDSLTFGTGVPKEEGSTVGKPGPGANGSIADILQAASSYSSGSHTESPRLHGLGETSDTSPSMQDAIQGMLCMSQGGSLSLPTASPPGHSTLGWTSPGRAVKPATPHKYIYDDDGIDKMHTCYKDDEFIYPTLDTSDTEDPHIFKPRGKQKRDDTWNPKAKLQPNCPKPERPQRQGTRRESVESGLAAAAAKLANAPMAKRQYIRHKPKAEKPNYNTLLNPQPGPSAPSKPALGSDVKRAHGAAPESPHKAKKPRKGMATAKQRLGRILKMHKMIH